jgi:hypothetical protein
MLRFSLPRPTRSVAASSHRTPAVSPRLAWLAPLFAFVCAVAALPSLQAADTPPAIVTQPADLSVDAGQPATFSVTATGTAPLAYQWKKAGLNLPGATNASYAIAAVQAADTGDYAVVVTNSAGSIGSRTATLSLNRAPVFLTQPADIVTVHGAHFSTSIQLSTSNNSPVTLQLLVAGQPAWLQPDTAPGTTNPISVNLDGRPLFLEDDGSTYQIVATNAYGSTASLARSIAVNPIPPAITEQPESQEASLHETVYFSVFATGTDLSYQWRKEGANIPDATDATLELPDVQFKDAGSYAVVISNRAKTIISRAVNLSVGQPYAPIILQAPVDTPATVGLPVQLSVSAKGSYGLVYQWYKNGQAIRDANFSVLSFASPTVADTGTYTVTVSNPLGLLTTTPVRLTVIPPTAPSITAQPQNTTVLVGGSATFTAGVYGSVPLTYQWSRAGFLLADGVGPSYTVSNISAQQSGEPYVLTVTNALGEAVSSPAYLYVETNPAPPVITASSPSLRAVPGETVTFSVTATGFGPLTYQWYRAATALPGATGATLTLSALTLADAGVYTCTVTSPIARITSPSIVLTVAYVPPSFTGATPASATKLVGDSATFSVNAGGSAPLTYQWYRDATPLPGATKSTLALATLSLADAGVYTVTVTNPGGTLTSPAARLTVLVPNPARLINFSILTDLPADDSFTLGFATGGTGTSGATKPVLLRAVGPALTQFGVPGVHPDPYLELYQSSAKIAANDNWADDPGSRSGLIFSSVGAFAPPSPASKDASLNAATLAPGSYSLRIAGHGRIGGAVVGELYETTPAADFTSATPRLVNLSVLKRLGSGVTLGFVVGGTGSRPVLIRAVGPALSGFGVDQPLADPTLVLQNSAGVTIASNDNWNAGDAATMTTVGAFALPAGSRDAALRLTLAPGTYTVQVSATSGSANPTGPVLVEVYEAP